MTSDIKIVFENDEVVVIDKPSGLSVHGDGKKTDPTVAEWFVATYPASAGVGEPLVTPEGVVVERSGIVHRLDKDTSGVMVLTKTPESYEHLKKQFQDRLVKKEYRAFVYGRLREKWGTIDRAIGRSSKDWRLRSAQRGSKGKVREAVTDWELVGAGEVDGELFSYVKLKPKTGRMHQLRVHLKAIDKPIVADPLYAGEKKTQSKNLGFDRLALHAHVLTFALGDGEVIRVLAPLPLSFEQAADLLHDE